MVDPSRAPHIDRFEVDEFFDGAEIAIDVIVADRCVCSLWFHLRYRTWSLSRSHGVRITGDLEDEELCRYLISILPAEIVAHCTAASLGFSHG